MSSHSAESIVEERVAQLEAITKRRNELLSQMHHMMRRRDVWSTSLWQSEASDTIKDEDEGQDDLQLFLDRFDMQNDPESGSIVNLPFPELLWLPAPPRGSHLKVRDTDPKPALHEQGSRQSPEPSASSASPSPPTTWPTGGNKPASASPTAESTKSDIGEHDDSAQPPSAAVADLEPQPQEDKMELEDTPAVAAQPSTAAVPLVPSPLSPRAASSAAHNDDDGEAKAERERIVIDLVSSPPPPSPTLPGTSPRLGPPAGLGKTETVDSLEAVRAAVLWKEEEEEGEEEEEEEEEGEEGAGAGEEEAGRGVVKKEDLMQVDEDHEHGHELHPPELRRSHEKDTMTDVAQDMQVYASPRNESEQEASGALDSWPVHPEYPEYGPAVADALVKTKSERSPTLALDFPSAPQPTHDSREDSDASMRDVSLHEGPLPLVTTQQAARRLAPVVLAPRSPIATSPMYSFSATTTEPDKPPEASPKSTRCPLYSDHYTQTYTLPPLKSLPVEFSRKGKPSKQRKREKEKERERCSDKAEGKKEAKDDWVPMGLNRWGAIVRANPVYPRIARATKCLSTHDWNIAIRELRLMRTIERIERLKDEGRWSFRQPKKQRGVGTLAKTHWDHLLDEMRWMRTDFREERKWKLCVAYNLSTAVLEWHDAGTLAERVARGISVLWKRPRALEEDNEGGLQDDEMQVDKLKSNRASLLEYGTDDDDDQEQDQQSAADDLEFNSGIQGALDDLEAAASGQNESPQSITELGVHMMKTEDVEDQSVLARRLNADAVDGTDVDARPDTERAADSAVKKQEDFTLMALKATSIDPILGDQSNSHSPIGDGEPAKIPTPSAAKANAYGPLREQIAYSSETKVFLDLDDLVLDRGVADLSIEDQAPSSSLPVDLSAIFPDLQLFEPLGIASASNVDARKRSDKGKDKNVSNKRGDDTAYTKLTPIGRLMHCKPTLLGALQPSKSWRSNRWVHLEGAAVTVDYESPIVRPGEDVVCDLYPNTSPLTPLFFVKSEKDKDIRDIRAQDKDSKKRIVEHVWTNDDDLCLKNLVEKYPRNWGLIAETFNSIRVLISTDKRTAKDCEDRWIARWASESRNVGGPSGEGALLSPATPTLLSVGQMTTRGVKRSLANNAMPSSAATSAADARKRRRRNLMQEAIRKAVKKREATQKSMSSQRKPSAIHDTHAQYMKPSKLTPADLSRMKAEKDHQAYMLARTRHMQEQAQRSANATNSHMLSHQQQNGAPRPTGASLPAAQVVPQIRSQVNISQQQRIPTPQAPTAPIAAGNARLQQQQILQAQVRAMAQVQAAQAQAQAHAQAQAQAMAAHAQSQAHLQGQPQVQPGQTPMGNLSGISNPHLSPPYGPRGSSSSPGLQQVSPPHSSGASVASNHPSRPPSAQQQATVLVSGNQPGGTALSRPPQNIYFPVPSGVQMTTEQMVRAMRSQPLFQGQHPPQNH